jgi:hypothetical protein
MKSHKVPVVSFKSTQKRMNCLKYNVCKCEIVPIGNCVAKINLYLNKSYFNLAPRVEIFV